MEQATFAAGCFWGVEAAFREVPGVHTTSVGYIGGMTANPIYNEVCAGTSGHAEATRVTFNPKEVSYAQLLQIFWQCHDPTQLNRQGPDVGTQYRSAIFFHSSEQQATASASKAQQENGGQHDQVIVTEITACATYHPAEDYHQQYLEKQGRAHCHKQ